MAEGLPAGKSGESATELSAAARIQILSTEHWSLLATRSLSWQESFSRTAMFLSTLTGAVVALALVGQAMPGQGFVVFALLLLPVVLFLGIATYARLIAINLEDGLWVIGMNRLRHAYMELAPELEQYFVTGVHDDLEGMMATFGASEGSRLSVFVHGFVTTPGMIGVVDAVVAGVLAGVITGVAGAALVGSIAMGAVAFVVTLALLMTYQFRSYVRGASRVSPRFPRAGR